MTNWDFIISKKYKEKIYRMIMVEGLRLHGGVIGDYDENNFVVTLLPDWVPYLKEYGIEYDKRTEEDYLDYINMRGRYSQK